MKRGQFYLVAALVIIGILATLTTVYNVAKTQREDLTVYDLSTEINYEAAQVIDNGIFTATSDEQIGGNVENLTDFYAEANPTSDLLVIYGNESELTIIFYNNTKIGSVGISFGGVPIDLEIEELRKLKGRIPRDRSGRVQVELNEGIRYTFELNAGQVFFIVLKKEKDEGRYVSLPDEPEEIEIERAENESDIGESFDDD
ncbi:hypothetical protein HY450_03825 [Candidatus Pacearchaeota archaeon]|nr:hypothetical protein [Candidatus Pacearchaeota archaeon]